MNNDTDLICYDGALGRMVLTGIVGEYEWQPKAKPAPVAVSDDEFMLEADDDPA